MSIKYRSVSGKALITAVRTLRSRLSYWKISESNILHNMKYIEDLCNGWPICFPERPLTEKMPKTY